MSETNPTKKASPLKISLLLLILGVLAFFLYKAVVHHDRKSKLSSVLINVSDSIDLDYHDISEVSSFFENVNQYNRVASKLWMKDGYNAKTEKTATCPMQMRALALLKLINNQDRKLKESSILKGIGLQNEDIHLIQDLNITPGVLIEAKELMTYSSLLKDKNVGAGSKPEDIWIIQKLLNYNDFNVSMDGEFNETTDKALTSFQRNNDLFVSHKVDNYTLSKLTER